MSLLLFDPPKPPEEPLFSLNHPCDPRGKSRPKAGRTGRVCRSCGTRTGSLVMRNNPADLVLEAELERAAREAMFRQGLHRLTVPLFCLVVARFPRVQDMPDRAFSGRQWRAKTPDFDNVGKLVTDALNGVVYGDDRQIVDGRIQTVFSATWEKPGIEVYLWEATPFPPELERAPQLEGA